VGYMQYTRFMDTGPARRKKVLPTPSRSSAATAVPMRCVSRAVTQFTISDEDTPK